VFAAMQQLLVAYSYGFYSFNALINEVEQLFKVTFFNIGKSKLGISKLLLKKGYDLKNCHKLPKTLREMGGLTAMSTCGDPKGATILFSR
jgi:hypothetical protein